MHLIFFHFFFLLLCTFQTCHSNTTQNNIENNPILSDEVKKQMQPYIIPRRHPMLPVLNAIFLTQRATLDENTFEAAGFIVKKSTRPRSFIKVASHPSMPGYLVKVYMDNELREKRDKPSWKWLVQRCEGARKISKIIRKEKFKYFEVAKKYIYPFPDEPSPPNTSTYKRHFALILVTDMKLANRSQNIKAWHDVITKKHLDELYDIISQAKGSSYRPDNIAYTSKGTFAFIDTEYPHSGPDFESIRPYLRRDMRDYWDKLVTKGNK